MPPNSKRFRPVHGGSIRIKSTAVVDPVYQMSGNAQPGTLVLNGSAKPVFPLDMVHEAPLPKGTQAFRTPQLAPTVEKAALDSLLIARPSKIRAPKRNTIKM